MPLPKSFLVWLLSTYHWMETSNNRRALLTVANDGTQSKQCHKRKNVIIFVVVIIIVVIALMLLFFIFDIFNTSAKDSVHAGMLGLWPSYGGSFQNKQSPPDSTTVLINRDNVKSLRIKWTYSSLNALGTSGIQYLIRYMTICDLHTYGIPQLIMKTMHIFPISVGISPQSILILVKSNGAHTSGHYWDIIRRQM